MTDVVPLKLKELQCEKIFIVGKRKWNQKNIMPAL